MAPNSIDTENYRPNGIAFAIVKLIYILFKGPNLPLEAYLYKPILISGNELSSVKSNPQKNFLCPAVKLIAVTLITFEAVPLINVRKYSK